MRPARMKAAAAAAAADNARTGGLGLEQLRRNFRFATRARPPAGGRFKIWPRPGGALPTPAVD